MYAASLPTDVCMLLSSSLGHPLPQVFLEESNDPLSDFAIGYEDYLQCPLQPLMDNLESQTYEIFEKCPVKYSQYQVRGHVPSLTFTCAT